jgi:hypothetical protein
MIDLRTRLLGIVLAVSALSASAARAQDVAPAMPGAPRQFELSVGVGTLSWKDAAGRGEIDSSLLFGLAIERRLVEFLSLGAGAGYGSTRITGEDRAADLDQYTLELVLQGRLAFASLRDLGLVPFLALSYGAIVHDPRPGDLNTRSQTSLGYGPGLDLDFGPRFGLRVEWRHYSVNLQDVFTPEDRAAIKTGADRIMAALSWRF